MIRAALLLALGLPVSAVARELDHDEADTTVGTARPDVLWVEQARLALGRERPDLARRYALRAVRETPEAWDAWRLYLKASSQAGLAAAAEAELAALDDPGARVALAWWMVANDRAPVDSLLAFDDPRARVAWGYSVLARGREEEVLGLELPDEPLAARLRLRALAMSGDARGLHAEAMDWLQRHPEHPDVLEELWRKEAPETRARSKVIRALHKRLQVEDDPAWLCLVSRPLVQARERHAAEAIAARIEAMGLLAPLPRKPWGGSMRRAMAQALVGQGPDDLPIGSEAEQVAVAWEVSEAWLVRDRAKDALQLWDELDSQRWLALRGRARVLEALGEGEEAAATREAAVRGAIEPWPTDPCGLDRIGRLTAVAAVASDGATRSDVAARRVLAGDHRRWRDLLADEAGAPAREELITCLDAMEGSALGPAWAGPVPAAAGPILPTLAREAIARLPDDVQQLAVPRDGVVAEGEPLPGRTLRLDDGDVEIHTLAAEPGALVLTLWASWCGPCQTELPQLDEVVSRLVAEGVPVQPVAISIDDDPRPYRRQLQRKPMPHLRVGRDPTLLAALGGSSLPVTWVVDDDAVVRLVHVGYDPELPGRLEALVREMEE